MQPLSFQPDRREIDAVPLEMYNKLVDELNDAQDELKRCRQKVAHLLKEKEANARRDEGLLSD